MKLTDIDKVNHLIADLSDINGLIGTAESAEGASTSHSRGTGVSTGFLASLKQLAVNELRARRETVLKGLTALGVDTSAG